MCSGTLTFVQRTRQMRRGEFSGFRPGPVQVCAEIAAVLGNAAELQLPSWRGAAKRLPRGSSARQLIYGAVKERRGGTMSITSAPPGPDRVGAFCFSPGRNSVRLPPGCPTPPGGTLTEFPPGVSKSAHTIQTKRREGTDIVPRRFHDRTVMSDGPMRAAASRSPPMAASNSASIAKHCGTFGANLTGTGPEA